MLRVPFRVLLYAHVDLNAVDGSAFFVAGAASLLTSAPGVELDVVTATPLRRAVVVHEMLVNPRVQVVDPFRDEGLAARRPEFRGATRMDEATAASVLGYYLERDAYDVVLVRSTEVADALARLRPDLLSRLCVYVTGVVAEGIPVNAQLEARLHHLAAGGATLLCQTPEMRDRVAELVGGGSDAASVAVMSPAVPAEDRVVPPVAGGPLLLAYTGKFAPAWNTVEMLAGFKEAASSSSGQLRLTVAGDYFKRPPDWPSFAAEARHLLGSHPHISWVGGITRTEARALVMTADVGLGWRHRSLDDSLELSTKLLENGALGRPTIINPTRMHERLFGADYPLFASSMTQYVDLLRVLAVDRSLVSEAAERAEAVAAGYTYERVFRSLFPTLARAATGNRGADAGGMVADIELLLRSTDRHLEHDGRLVSWLTDADDAAGILARSGVDAVAAVESFGPFVRWQTSTGVPGAVDEPLSDRVPVLRVVVDALTSRGPTSGAATGATTAPDAVSHDRAGRVTPGPAAPTPSTAEAAARPAVPREDGRVPEDLATRLGEELARQRQETARLTQRYAALSSSRLGRVQVRLWRTRRRLRRVVRRARA